MRKRVERRWKRRERGRSGGHERSQLKLSICKHRAEEPLLYYVKEIVLIVADCPVWFSQHRCFPPSSCRKSVSGYVVKRSSSNDELLSLQSLLASSLNLASRSTSSVTNRGSSTIQNTKRTLTRRDCPRGPADTSDQRRMRAC